ncbi:MAG: hypothetical protein KGQ60_11395, partial [Planctomycetes bacterium]|nr:hypothetical protein [Planctomycetota bacterium]
PFLTAFQMPFSDWLPIGFRWESRLERRQFVFPLGPRIRGQATYRQRYDTYNRGKMNDRGRSTG